MAVGGGGGLRSALGGWRLPDLPTAWVDTIWDLDFTETEPLDPRIEEEITAKGLDTFTCLYDALAPFGADNQESQENIWTLFAENNLSHHALVAVLHHFVHVGQQKRANAQQRVFGLHSAGLYFLLLEIPGSRANQLFHQIMFDECLHTLTKCWPQVPEKRKKTVAQSSQPNARRNRKKAKPGRNDNSSMMMVEGDEMLEGEEDGEHVYFTTEDLQQIRSAIFLLLKNFLRLLPNFSLKEKPQCMQTCLQVFVAMTTFESVLNEVEFSAAMDVNNAKYIPELAYYGLYLLCSPLHGREDETLRCVFNQLLNVILMVKGRGNSRREPLAITSAVTSARNLAVKFISSLVDELKEAVFPLLRIFLQHICDKVPDKAEYRTNAAQALVTLLEKFPSKEFASFITWLYKFSLGKVSCRVFALDAALALLELPERNPGSSLPPELQRFLKHKFLVQVMVFGRCSDRAAVVRSKALSSFAHCLEMKTAAILESIQDLLQSSSVHTVSEANTNTVSGTVSAETTSSCPLRTPPISKTTKQTASSDTCGPRGKEVMAILRMRANDEKTNVRKAALQVLATLLKQGLVACTAEDVGVLQEHCRDPAVSVRKQSLLSITELLQAQQSDVLVQKAWLYGVVPIVTDVESSVQEKALDCLDQFLLQHIKVYHRSSSSVGTQKLAWDLLSLLSSECQDLSRYLNKAFQVWSRQKKLTSTFTMNVMSHLETGHSREAWMLLAKGAGSFPRLNYSKVAEYWDRVSRQQDVSSDTIAHVLCVIGHVAKHLCKTSCDGLKESIWNWLKEFQCPLRAISPAVEALHKLCQTSAETPQEAQEQLNEVFGDLVSTCESYISSIILKEGGGEQLQEDLLVKHLFLLGDAAQMCPAKVGKPIFFLIQSILASSFGEDQHSKEFSCFQSLSQFRGSAMPTVVRAHAFITLGKLCLQHEELAKETVPTLARELEVSPHLPVRNNVIIVLCDLCMRYTSMVDRYMGDIALCLRDTQPLIREQALSQLTNLLQEEFVKLKDGLFFRFVIVLVDPVPEIARLAEFCLLRVLLKKNPGLFSQHFIECIFHFNSYEKHPKYNRFPQSPRAKQLFSLKGKENKEKRMRIYTFLLDHFTDEQRFNITTTITNNILACFVDELLPLDLESSELLSDTFAVLSCKEIKLSSMRSKPEEDIDPEEDEMAMANAVMQVTQKKLISQVQKKNLIEEVIPVITSLKDLMEEKRIPALKDLMNYLREMMQDYRNEIQEFFALDKQLAAELEYDMRKHEEQLAREKELEQQQPSSAFGETLGAIISQSPSLEGAASSGGQNNDTPQASAGGTQSTSIPSSEFAAPRADAQPGARRKAASLTTMAILNAAKKAAEDVTKKQRSKSMGRGSSASSEPWSASQQGLSPSLSPQSNGGNVAVAGRAISTPVGLFPSLSPQSSGGNVAGRAISTPEETIGDFTLNAGVSSISLKDTPSSAPVEEDAEDRPRHVICLKPPEEPPSPPRMWKVESPARRESSQPVALQRVLRTARKTSQKK